MLIFSIFIKNERNKKLTIAINVQTINDEMTRERKISLLDIGETK